MPMIPEQILQETSQWPADKVAELVGSLLLSLDDAVDPQVEDAWKQEVRRRVSGSDGSARIRRIVGR
jgi:hypothetical protein